VLTRQHRQKVVDKSFSNNKTKHMKQRTHFTLKQPVVFVSIRFLLGAWASFRFTRASQDRFDHLFPQDDQSGYNLQACGNRRGS
jgi:hypothetical protein